MVRRLKALFLLFAIGLVLPAAAVPQRFCTTFSVILSEADCCTGECPCCGDTPSSPFDPDCVVTLKSLPEATGHGHLHLPELSEAALPASSCAIPSPVLSASHPSFTPHQLPRPPGRIPIYLVHRSMLI